MSTMTTTIEELGRGLSVSLDLTIHFSFTPGEEPVCYYPNGDGYPGSPPEVEPYKVTVDRIDGDTYRHDRDALVVSGWASVLDGIATGLVEERWPELEEQALEKLNAQCEAAQEAAWESKMGF